MLSRLLKKNSTLLILSSLSLCGSALADHSDGIWKISKPNWSSTDEAGFTEFVSALGNAQCNTAAKCINHPANPFARQNPASLKNAFSDCADLPYILRAYYAFMNDLPFSFVSGVEANGSGSGDIRYSKNGNRVTRRRVIRSGENIAAVLKEIANTISSAMFRMPPETNNLDSTATDFYSPAVTPASIRPGTIIYDPNGHVAVIYKVEKDGRIRFMDSHPDNSVTRGVYGEKFARSRPAAGAGFKNWRPFMFESQTVRPMPNQNIRDFSLVQFYGTHPNPSSWSAGKFVIGNQNYDYYDYVRLQLAGTNFKFNPVSEFKNMLEALCQDSRDRIAAVQAAIANGLNNKSHPDRLPENIYGTSGEWESFSSPSRDARLKTSFVELQKRTEQFITLVSQNSPLVEYTAGLAQLKTDLRNTYAQATQACVLTYTNSQGRPVNLNLREIELRLWKLSFDPYHCVELRWGAQGQELSSCPDSRTKLDWYQGEQRLRNQIERTYDVRMGFSLGDLGAKVPGSGVDQPPRVDLQSLLN